MTERQQTFEPRVRALYGRVFGRLVVRLRPTPWIKVGRLVVFPTGPAKRWGRTRGVLGSYLALGPVSIGWTIR